MTDSSGAERRQRGVLAELQAHRDAAYGFLRGLLARPGPHALRTDVLERVDALVEQHPEVEGTELVRLLRSVQEAVLENPWVAFSLRPSIGRWRWVSVHADTLDLRDLQPAEFLAFKERLVLSGEPPPYVLELDLGPFSREVPKLREPRSIGGGVEFLNRKLSSELFGGNGRGYEQLLDFLQAHEADGHPLMLNDRVRDVESLRRAIHEALARLAGEAPDAPWAAVAHPLQELGLEPGWGDDVARTRETLALLAEVLEAPEPRALEELLARVPMIFRLAIVSPHGFFGQSGVLGLPDTGGQVVYILDQVRALEHEMRARLRRQGLDLEPEIVVLTRLIPDAPGTTCAERLEPITGTQRARILRVPFREPDGHVVPRWISRFEVWPYLERFAHEARRELVAELGGRPDLVIGNYSDGNLVAYLLCRELGVTQCNIAHALEKTKYLHSDLYWASDEGGHHFDVQFTADLIAMNAADFILTSTFQEIAGTHDAVGQYESYRCFTLPDLYRVIDGVDVFDARFNVVSPGADPATYFDAAERERRLTGLHPVIEELITGDAHAPDRRGALAEPDKPLLFSMARLDAIKNISGLVEWYARSPRLQRAANLLVIAGHVELERSSDAEERREIERMHALFDEHALDDRVRWLGVHLDKPLAGELYRVLADRRGAFVQPARFEAFGLTVVEAMVSGLPTFATCYGGPLEIIEDGVSGFHVDPNLGDAAAERIADFFERAAADPAVWERIARAGVERIHSRYTWSLHAERLMTLARVYGFWKHISDLSRRQSRRYIDMFYGLQFRPRAQTVPLAER